ncbi:MAG: c-type cytochrome, partial [Gemmatimonadales bacterium]
SETQRWNVTAFLYTLSASAEAIERGRAVFADRCAGCHGPAGQGDGPEGDGALPDFTAPEFFALTSQAVLDEAVAGEVAPGAHTFSDALGEDERRAVAALVRALGYTQDTAAAATPGRLKVQGAVTNGTAGGRVPAGLPVVLHVFDRFQEIGVFTTTAAGGQYTFSDVPLAEEPFAVVTADYGGVGYASEVIELTGSESVIELPLEVFETTTDPGAIRVQSWHIFLEMQSPGTAQVGELMVFSNEGDRTLVASAAGGATLEIPLPPGAERVQFDDGVLGERYLPTPEGFAHTLAVRPGPQALRVLVSFNLPLAGRLEFAQTAPYPVTAVDVFAPESVLRVASRQLSGPVPQEVEGTRYAIYRSTDRLPAGSTLALTVMPAGASANVGLLAAAGGLLALAGL